MSFTNKQHLKLSPPLSFILSITIASPSLFFFSDKFQERQKVKQVLSLLQNSSVEMSYSDPNQNPIPETYIPSNSNDAEKLKLYQAFIFSVPICFTFIVLFVLYVIYLRRNSTTSVDWSSLGMRGGSFVPTNNNLSTV